MKQSSATSQLRSVLPTLSEAERRVALRILERPHDVIHQSMSAIAQSVEVSDTTVLRMCRAAGFGGYTDLKIALAREPFPPADTGSDDPPTDSLQTANSVFRAIGRALDDTMAVLDRDTFNHAIEQIANARHILAGGVGGSGIVAQAFYQRCFRLGLRCDAPVDAQLQIMHAAGMGSQDLVVVISYSGITSDPVLLLREAKTRGTQTICITGNRRSPLAQIADTVLVSVSYEYGSEPMAAQVAQLTLIDALYAALTTRMGKQAQLIEERMVSAILPKSI